MSLTKEAWQALKAIPLPKWVPSVLAVPNRCEVCKGPLPKHDTETFMRFCSSRCRAGRHNRKWLTVAALLVLLVSACTPHVSSHIKYFGYAASGEDPASIAATAGFTNIATVSGLTCVNQCPMQVAAARAGKVKLVIELRPVLFTSTGALRPDYLAQWAALQTFVTPSLDAIFGFTFDEPTHNGISATDLTIAVNLAKSTYPSLNVSIVEAYTDVGNIIVPPNVDLLGFDRYAVANPNTDTLYVTQYNTIAARRSSPTQRMIVVLDGWWFPGYSSYGLTADDMAAVATNYKTFADARPEVAAVIVFLWPSIPSLPPGAITSIQRPDWIIIHRKIGKEIAGK